ncbi:hypothetical protein [Thermostaphylospora chromogena]|uniref:X-X-X-Leu-X-X-Gly heptad repeat-containing protein n=1 Tax=Thermostaphylospora chromogena TaxID=35622 RepID=A0A1H1I7C5_9ACTN|nr:hypothetical protein [Thermostaphylospora chromogena]SDR33562.1 X-X-X-Leu-X-X-Gly heptad repeat-containing protein [Thermostaphylospora chromogena]
MSDFGRLKALIDSEVQALGDRAQAASDLANAFEGGEWDESVISFLGTYRDGIIGCRNHLLDLRDHVAQREEQARAEKANPFSVLAQIAARLEEAGGRLAAGVGTLQEASGQLTTGIQTLQEFSGHFATGVGKLQESVQLYQGIADYVRESASTFESDGSAGPAAEDDPVPPDPEEDEDPPQDPDLWRKS